MASAIAAASAASGDELRSLIAPLVNAIGGPLTALRAIQGQDGWIRPEGIEAVADVFNLSRAEVRGLVAFYADFRTQPPADHIVRVCQAEACQAAGSRALTQTLGERLGTSLGHATPDRRVELDAVYCLGLCARAPALMVDGELIADADGAIERVVQKVQP
ncbi:MAG: NAD(P)H-dependent oxidoreductase subunit E [Candidatus Limnocylindrales bacterium]